jgi:tetratricopeptide (TPR) repeat protein
VTTVTRSRPGLASSAATGCSHDPELGRAVAIKLVYAPAFAAPEKLRSRLLREAKLLAKLAHPNVVRVYDCGQHEGEVYLAMEHVQGTTLRAWQTAGPRTPVAIVDAYVAAAAGLAAAHDLGIVHRDFKPDNVLVADDGGILVGDFGLAVGGVDEVRPVEADGDGEGEPQPVPAGPLAAMTKTGALLGTVLYMAPEQLRGEPATASSDQFAFCVALWEALAGRRPFEGDEQAGLLAAIEKGRPAGGERIPKKLRRALERGLSLDPADRYPNVRMLAAALRGRRGPSGTTMMVLVAASLGAGLFMYPMLFESASSTDVCKPERTLAQVRTSKEWDALHQRLVDADAEVELARLERHSRRLEARAHDLCEHSSAGDESKRQHLQAWIDGLSSFLATGRDRPLGGLLEDIGSFENARLTAPPLPAMDEGVIKALDQSREHERSGDLSAALVVADQAVQLAGERSLEQTIAQQRRGRVLTLLGRHDEAIQAFRAAISEAEASAYDAARLDARLLAARTVIMRLEQLERGQDVLEEVGGLLERLDEPWPSTRWAEHSELRASLLKRQGRTDEALGQQWLVILQHALLGNVYETGLAYVNLGTIYERRALSQDEGADDLRHARTCYEHALELLEPMRGSPAWGMAAYNLGHWLVNNGEPDEYARAERLLEGVRDTQPELRSNAIKALLIVGIQRGPEVDLGPISKEWVAVLEREPPASASAAFDAWVVAAIAAASMGDTAAFERAAGEVEASAAEIVRTRAQPENEVALRLITFELNAAGFFFEADRPRAQALARAARERLNALPSDGRPAAMVTMADEFLAG